MERDIPSGEERIINPILRHLDDCGERGSDFGAIVDSVDKDYLANFGLPLVYVINSLIKDRKMYYWQGRYYKNK